MFGVFATNSRIVKNSNLEFRYQISLQQERHYAALMISHFLKIRAVLTSMLMLRTHRSFPGAETRTQQRLGSNHPAVVAFTTEATQLLAEAMQQFRTIQGTGNIDVRLTCVFSLELSASWQHAFQHLQLSPRC